MKKIKDLIQKLMTIILIILIVFAVVQKISKNEKGIFGIKIFTVLTGSMIPVYNIGDIIIVKEVAPEELEVGDDIVYRGEEGAMKDKTITHRIMIIDKSEEDNYRIYTKGVANLSQDPMINQHQVYGKVIGKIIIVNLILKIIFKGYILIIIPVAILVRKNIKKIKTLDKSENQ